MKCTYLIKRRKTTVNKQLLPETITGTRIELQRQNIKNADIMFQYVDQDRERLSRFLPWPKFIKSVEDEIEFINKCSESWNEFKAAQYAIFSKSDNEYMGNVGAFNFDWDNENCEIGYWILGQFEGNDFMSDAVELLEKALFEAGFHRIIIKCDPENSRSRNIPNRLNYVFEGTLRDCKKHGDKFVSLETHSKLKKKYK